MFVCLLFKLGLLRFRSILVDLWLGEGVGGYGCDCGFSGPPLLGGSAMLWCFW